MKTKLVAALLTALGASLAAPAFASGYGPAPFYRPSVGAPTPQRVQIAGAPAAEHDDTADMQRGRGGVAAGSSQSGSRAAVTLHDDPNVHH
ncbi:hypothetical protein [Paraburkholderia fungorum]|uniref:hypothetical protein n=1 Tax=Paraburkholderia fungorum TaxID=134537 RepID=UPI0038B92F8F